MAGLPPMSLGLQQLLPLTFVKIIERRTLFKSKFIVTNEAGDRIFTVREVDSSLMHHVAGRDRRLHFIDENEQCAVTLRQPLCLVRMNKMEVIINGETVSVIRQEATFLKSVLSINDANDVPVLRVKGLECLTLADAKYELQGSGKIPIGTIVQKNKWTEPDHYHVTFPADLDVRYKVTVISTCLLIDYHRDS